jgi:tagatose 1,6-diphosphate aldolase
MATDRGAGRKRFRFRQPGRLVDGDLELVLVERIPADPVTKYSPVYHFEMRRVGGTRALGGIRLRIDATSSLRYPGHIGYEVRERSRGRHLAARSCRLLYPLVHAHGLNWLWITCDPTNVASARSCELAGGKFIDVLVIPKVHPMYDSGFRRIRRYRVDVRRELARGNSDAARSAAADAKSAVSSSG